ncbi:MAG: hypothetical protein KC505_02085 [Myxococcales bacterium]|nr:hypothetical protein [Myxococcales bacterium]USN49989.1 MAG: hypothetical protein H6731_06860 [Myxococcales bacterium]
MTFLPSILFFLACSLWAGGISYNPFLLEYSELSENGQASLSFEKIKLFEVSYELKQIVKEQLENARTGNYNFIIFFSGRENKIENEVQLLAKVHVDTQCLAGNYQQLWHEDIKYQSKKFFGFPTVSYRVAQQWKEIKIISQEVMSELVEKINYAKEKKCHLWIDLLLLEKINRKNYIIAVQKIIIFDEDHKKDNCLLNFLVDEAPEQLEKLSPYEQIIIQNNNAPNFKHYIQERIKWALENNRYIFLDRARLIQSESFEQIDEFLIVSKEEVCHEWLKVPFDKINFFNKKKDEASFIRFSMGEKAYLAHLHTHSVEMHASYIIAQAHKEKREVLLNVAALKSKRLQELMNVKYLMVLGNKSKRQTHSRICQKVY